MSTKRPIPKNLNVIVDSAEKKSLKFFDEFEWWAPDGRSQTIKITPKPGNLCYGDYAIEGLEHTVLAETKRSLDELSCNLFGKDSKRSDKTLAGFAKSCRYPLLVLDFGLLDSYACSYSKVPASKVITGAFSLAANLGVQLVWLNGGSGILNRKMVGTQIVRLMWTLAWHALENPIKVGTP